MSRILTCFLLWPLLQFCSERSSVAADVLQQVKEAQIEYAAGAKPIRDSYSRALNSALEQARKIGDEKLYLLLANHHAALHLTMDDEISFPDELKSYAKSDLLEIHDEYMASIAKLKDQLLTKDQEILKSIPIEEVALREQLQEEMSAIQNGERVPSVILLPASQSFTELKWASEAKTASSLENPEIPDEFSVIHAGQSVRITGKKVSNITKVGKKTCGHLGKILLFDPIAVRSRPRQSGYLRIGNVENDVAYALVAFANGVVVKSELALEENKLYQWSISTSRGDAKLVVKDWEQTVTEFEFPAVPGVKYGILAQARWPGQKVHIEVSYTDTSKIK